MKGQKKRKEEGYHIKKMKGTRKQTKKYEQKKYIKRTK
jgi:hypothetical protein